MNGTHKICKTVWKDQTYKFIDNIFNQIIEEQFSNLRKEMLIQVQEVERVPNIQDQKRNSNTI